MVALAQTEAFLNTIVSTGSPSHAYLFFGPLSSEKESKAKAFIKALLCKECHSEGCHSERSRSCHSERSEESALKADPSAASRPQDDRACGECVSCRKLDSGNHPDFREAGVEEDRIKIAEVRALQEDARYAPFESKWKIYYLPHAERLTEEAAQSMLKILEEPPPYVVFVLTAVHPTGVLPTIASRCQRVPFQSATSSQVTRQLVNQGLPEDIASLLSHLDISLPEAAQWNVLVAEAAPILFSETRAPMEVFEQGGALEDYKDEGEKLLHLLFAFYRDVAIQKAEWDEGLLFPKFKERTEVLSKALSWETLWERSQAILDAKNQLRHYGNFRLVMENLLWKLKS